MNDQAKPSASFQEREDRKRRLTAYGLTILLYALVFGFGIFIGILSPKEQAFSNSTVVINLAGPEKPEIGLGSVAPSEKGEEKKLEDNPSPSKPAVESPKAETPKTKTETAKSVEKTVAPPKQQANPSTNTASDSAEPLSTAKTPGPSSSAVQPETVPAEPWVPGQRGPGSRVSSSNSAVNVPGQGEVPWSQGNSVQISKKEKGNSSETSLGASQGTVGHNIYVPVFYSLPLPRTVPAYIYDAIPDLVQPPNTILYTAQARKKAFTNFYVREGDLFRLKNDVPLDYREQLWQILEDAGYDVMNADYKQDKNLMPVVIGFTVTKDNQIKGVEILQSSGDPEIDRSVVYGFKRAAFWNKTGETVPGRFTYRF